MLGFFARRSVILARGFSRKAGKVEMILEQTDRRVTHDISKPSAISSDQNRLFVSRVNDLLGEVHIMSSLESSKSSSNYCLLTTRRF